MYFGVDYYPEQWVFPYGGTREKPEGAWEQDAQLMVKAGVNVVRMGEFAWGLCEPEDGKFDFGWLKRVMDVMGKHGIKVVLATPTAAPPIWLAQKISGNSAAGRTGHRAAREAPAARSVSTTTFIGIIPSASWRIWRRRWESIRN